jgi:hypothetical protein
VGLTDEEWAKLAKQEAWISLMHRCDEIEEALRRHNIVEAVDKIREMRRRFQTFAAALPS